MKETIQGVLLMGDVLNSENFRLLLSNPRLGLNFLSKRSLNAIGRFANFGTNPFDREWDVLVVLDACRYDLFQEVAPEHPVYEYFDSVEPVYSCASSTPEWMEKVDSVPVEELSRTNYVSANGYFDTVHEDSFRDFEAVWEYGHDQELNTVPPDVMTDVSLQEYRGSDAERFVFHYLQPHAPFLHCPGKYGSMDGYAKSHVWVQLERGQVDRDEVWRDYALNLAAVLEHVETIIRNVSGKVVVTADHGNGLGEWGIFGHPDYVPVPGVKRVPWAEAEGLGLDEYEPSGEAEESKSGGRMSVEDHLQDLGYL